MERTLLIIKPDGVERGLVGEILMRVERKGYRIERICEMTISHELAQRHYAEHKGKPFYDDLIDYITGGLSIVAIIRGENAIENMRIIMGATDPLDATSGSIRGGYATSVTHNLVHGSDSAESATREIDLFFG
ncbi:MAG: nucleoside-diphosphate kinase [Candidatus Anoxymicrobium japonicum]|uniref:Nucleoside diphosphate kinase n=1 Tax=Candidatus Anoxymicrobium japonicum TaxID=2013648 RepID=A0A2N3G7U9_9ACTN|nr:MAG: nucleoside-diphosphate kinase [Candidatus Anoxymicrobium japonicum]